MKIALIENIAVLEDQFDVMDFSDNEIHKLDNFPRLSRLHTIIAHNNYISRIGHIGDQLPSLHALILTSNRISHFSELKNLSSASSLEYVSMLENPITARQYYRAYMIYKFSKLKLLDFRKVTVKERQQVKEMFSGESGTKLLEAIELDAAPEEVPKVMSLTEYQKQQVREAIERANTKEQIDIIERQLKVKFEIHFCYFCMTIK